MQRGKQWTPRSMRCHMFVWLQHMPMRGSPTWGKASTGPNVYRTNPRAQEPQTGEERLKLAVHTATLTAAAKTLAQRLALRECGTLQIMHLTMQINLQRDIEGPCSNRERPCSNSNKIRTLVHELQFDNSNQQVRSKQPCPHCPPGANNPCVHGQKVSPETLLVRALVSNTLWAIT